MPKINLEEKIEKMILALDKPGDEVSNARYQIQLRCLELLLKVRTSVSKGEEVKAGNGMNDLIKAAREGNIRIDEAEAPEASSDADGRDRLPRAHPRDRSSPA